MTSSFDKSIKEIFTKQELEYAIQLGLNENSSLITSLKKFLEKSRELGFEEWFDMADKSGGMNEEEQIIHSVIEKLFDNLPKY